MKEEGKAGGKKRKGIVENQGPLVSKSQHKADKPGSRGGDEAGGW